ncbi:MAG: hypothetical protein ACI9FU_001111 [Granulosicoccus sp.]
MNKFIGMSIKPLLLLVAAMLCCVPSTFAYLDPGSGSYIVQMIIAAALGGFYAIRLYWAKILNFIKGEPEEVDPDEELDNE